MKKFLQKKLKDQKGMTLIELLAVIVIIAIIAAIAIPAIGNIIENSRNGAVKADFQNAIAAANLYVTEEGSVPSAGIVLDNIKPYLEDQGALKTVTITREASSGSLVVEGTAELNNGTAYAITVPLTNSDLGAIENKDFSGSTIGATPEDPTPTPGG